MSCQAQTFSKTNSVLAGRNSPFPFHLCYVGYEDDSVDEKFNKELVL